MPSFGSGYRGDMTPPEKKPTLEEINAELLAALKDTVKVARKCMIYNGTDAEHADGRLGNAIATIARAEGRS
jgi:hypothetical protein